MTESAAARPHSPPGANFFYTADILCYSPHSQSGKALLPYRKRRYRFENISDVWFFKTFANRCYLVDQKENLLYFILVRNFYLISAKKENLRRLFAVFFLIILLAEWGSHGMNNQRASSIDAQAISADQGSHDDPCRSLIVCSDSQRKDRQMPTFSHEVMHNGLLDLMSAFRPRIDVQGDSSIPFATANFLFRPPDPAFHPPELS